MWFLNKFLAACLLFHGFIDSPSSSNFLKLYSLPQTSHLYPGRWKSLDDPSLVFKASILYHLSLDYLNELDYHVFVLVWLNFEQHFNTNEPSLRLNKMPIDLY